MSNQIRDMSPWIVSEIDFAFDLLRQQKSSESVVFSPVSISSCLALLHAAASEETRNQIRMALLKNATDEEFEKYFSGLYKTIINAKDETEVKIVNHLFCLENHPIKTRYLTAVAKLYNAEATSVDFKNKVESADVMNKYVAEATKEQIAKIISPDEIDVNLVALFTNAIYFKAKWQEEFPDIWSYDGQFAGRPITVMRNLGHKYYSEDQHFQMLKLPYLDSRYDMNIFLPKKRFGLKEALQNSSPGAMHGLLIITTEEYCDIIIPQWQVESNMNLNDTLTALGITLAFDINNEEFKNFAENSKVAHSAKIKVEMGGTNAADIVPFEFKEDNRPANFITFKADHPFMFIITKTTNDHSPHPIFMGTYY